MPFTINAAAGQYQGGAGANTLTISAAAGKLIAVACSQQCPSGAAPGSLADSGGNTYLAGNSLTTFASFQQDTFYCLAAASGVTTITYTPVGTSVSWSVIGAWV